MTNLATNKLIRASAGTGKTFQLSNRYIELLCEGTQPRKILATTFTRKAAGEILDRVIERLATAALGSQAASSLVDVLNCDLSLGKSEPQGYFGSKLHQMVSNFNQLQIGTLDAFFAQIARSFTVEIGLRPDWHIIEETDMDLVKDEAIRRLLTENQAQEVVYLLANGQAETTVSKLVRDTIDALYVHYLESSEGAWERYSEDYDRIESLLEDVQREFESVGPQQSKSIAKRMASDLERAQNRNFDAILSSNKLAEVCQEGGGTYSKAEVTSEVISAYQLLFQLISQDFINRIAIQNKGAKKLLDSYHKIYLQLENENGTLRFDSVTRRVGQVLEQFQLGHVSYRLEQEIRHLLLDEFQDTSAMQWQVLEPFATQAIAAKTDGSLFCVGDTKQAIYGWRGGIAELFDKVDKLLDDSAERIPLNESHRSSQVIMDVVNDVFSPLKSAAHFDGLTDAIQSWASRFETHRAFNQDKPGYVCCERAQPGQDVMLLGAERIQQLAQDYPGRSIGVLVRTNKLVGRMINNLNQLGVHASEEGGNPLLDSAAVSLIFSLLTLIDHPGNRVAEFHVANSALGRKLKIQVSPSGKQLSSLERCQQLRKEIDQEGLGKTVKQWADELIEQCTPREKTRLQQLIELAYAYGEQDSNLSVFRQRIVDSKVDEPSGVDIRVMTIHQAKGLEFDIVVLPHLDRSLNTGQDEFIVDRDDPTGPVSNVFKYAKQELHGILPAEIQKTLANQLTRSVSEELCNLYVAMTRPIHHLHMIVDGKAGNTNRRYHGIILSGLEDRLGESGRWETGDANWHQQTEPTESTDDLVQLIGDNPFDAYSYSSEIKLKGDAGDRLLPFNSPSRKEGTDLLELGYLLHSQGNQAAMSFGTLIHACFELVEWIEDGIGTNAQISAELVRQFAGDAIDAESTVQAFLKYIEQPNTRKFLTKEWFSENIVLGPGDSFGGFDLLDVENERNFAIKQSGEILQGSIDRLVVRSDGGDPVGAAVIDFKTDEINSDSEMNQKIDFYRPQLEGYRGAAARFLGIEPAMVRAFLIFLGPDKVQELK